jgi:hypothetical protein
VNVTVPCSSPFNPAIVNTEWAGSVPLNVNDGPEALSVSSATLLLWSAASELTPDEEDEEEVTVGSESVERPDALDEVKELSRASVELKRLSALLSTANGAVGGAWFVAVATIVRIVRNDSLVRSECNSSSALAPMLRSKGKSDALLIKVSLIDQAAFAARCAKFTHDAN